ncbi:MAG: hypothetical protein K0R12_121 [Gammaproteobacteria bacterium]|jgi:hypothetical protein|nr:hypothetical protein [Gammaproteobacteria bacterium]
MSAQPADNGRYRPLYKTLTLGTNQYAIVDKDVAHRRADRYYHQALALMDVGEAQNQSRLDPTLTDKITDALLLATDLGSHEAPMLLAQRIIDSVDRSQLPREDVVVFLRIAAERHNAEAAYRLGCSYAAINTFPEIEILLEAETSLDSQERRRMATHYLMVAVDQQHHAAIETLILAYAYGRPYIPKDQSQFVNLCTALVRRGNQAVALGFGAWLAGMTVDGKPPLADAIEVTQNPELSLSYLLMASRGRDLALAQHALQLISMGIESKVWGEELKNSAFKRTLIQDALNGNVLLACYLAWYSLAEDKRQNLPALFTDCACAALDKVFVPCAQRAAYYFEIANKSDCAEIKEAARSFSRQVFSGYVDALNSLK